MTTKNKTLVILACIGLNIFGWALGFNLYDVLKPNPKLFDIIEYSLLGTGWLLLIICIIAMNIKNK